MRVPRLYVHGVHSANVYIFILLCYNVTRERNKNVQNRFGPFPRKKKTGEKIALKYTRNWLAPNRRGIFLVVVVVVVGFLFFSRFSGSHRYVHRGSRGLAVTQVGQFFFVYVVRILRTRAFTYSVVYKENSSGMVEKTKTKKLKTPIHQYPSIIHRDYLITNV